MIRTKLVGISLFLYVLSASALENQFICTFGTKVNIASLNPYAPQPKSEKTESVKYTFMVDSVKPLVASYINLSQGIKSSLHAYRNNNSYIFIEANTGNNHFIVTVFTEKKLTDGFHAVMSFHSSEPTDSNDFYAQSIRVGRCF